MASEYILKNRVSIPVGGKADIVDGEKIKADCWYIVENNKWVEVDFTDKIFSYVISNKNSVKKVKTDKGEVLYIVSDDKGNSAHGRTIKQAREDLVYKVSVDFEGDIPDSATGKEWVAIYRAATGACSAGVKSFVEDKNKNLDKTYTKEQVLEIIQGQYGAEKFKELCKKGDGAK